MNTYAKSLEKCILFKHLNEAQIQSLLKVLQVKSVTYTKESIVALEGDQCTSLGILASGKLELQNIYPSGKVATLTTLMPGQCFGEAILFSDADRYPISAVAKQKSTVFFVEKQSIMHGLTHHPILLDNFLRLLSNKLTMMNRKIKVLSLDTIRQKVCNYLLKEYQLQGTNMIQTAMSRKAMAEHMSIQRPSLSRELIKMKEEHLIDFDKSTIKILDVEALEDELIG